MKTCKKCGKPLSKCNCLTDVNLEHVFEQFEKEKEKGHTKKDVSEEEVKKKLKQTPPRTENDLIAFCNFVGFDENARRRFLFNAKKSFVKHAKKSLKGLIDDLIPNPEDICIEAEYEIECPVCGKMVKDLEKHRCAKK